MRFVMPPSRSLKTGRACDGCRRRKVKCDAEQPCANCRVSSLTCQYTIPPKKRGPKVSRSEFHNDAGASGLVISSSQIPSANRAPIPATGFLGNLLTADADSQSWETSIPTVPLENGLGPPEQHRYVRSSTELWRLKSPPVAGLLPVTNLTKSSTASTQSCRKTWDKLFVLFTSALPSIPMIDAVNYCIDLYMQYTFPTAPIIHEPTLRADAFLFFSRQAPQIVLFGDEDEIRRVAHMRAFAHITALCASVAAVLPERLLPYRHVIAIPFLRASRKMLKAYEEYDFEHPNSTSLSIRMLQSTALQSTSGKTGAAWHVLGQAALLAQNLNLHREDAIAQYSPTEGQLLRLTFWHLYSSDQAAACLRSRPFVLHETLFEGKMNLHDYGEHYTPLVDTSTSWYQESFEERLLVGFHLIPRLWSSASRLIGDIRAFEMGGVDPEDRKTKLTQLYLDMTSIIDDLPHWLQTSQISVAHDDGKIASYHKTSFGVQKCNIMTTFHCLKLVILQQCTDSGLCSIMGLNDQPLTLLIKRVEMINEFLQILEDMPFLYHQVKGEPSVSQLRLSIPVQPADFSKVERIRRVGTILLRVIETADNDIIKARAESYSTRLLNILAKLNSKASDELESRVY